jgi:hypothetical protein
MIRKTRPFGRISGEVPALNQEFFCEKNTTSHTANPECLPRPIHAVGNYTLATTQDTSFAPR